MPELPEVETIRRNLLDKVTGNIIRELEVCPGGQRLLRRTLLDGDLAPRVAGKQITGIKRRAKYLLFQLEEKDKYLIIHLGMSGQLLYRYQTDEIPRHARIVLHLSPRGIIYFNDPRKFGEIYLFSQARGWTKVNPFRLGPEPLEKEFSLDLLAHNLKNKKTPIKSALLNQTTIAGLGNIYTDEALFGAGIHPLRLAGSLDREELKLLRQQIRLVLREAIRLHGTSAADRQYVDAQGQLGQFQTKLKVYQRAQKPCPKCQTLVETLKVQGRTTHFCPQCQPPEIRHR